MSVELFSFMDNKVRVVVIEGEPWFVLTDVATILGYEQAQKAKRVLSDGEYSLPPRETKADLGVRGSLPTIVTESGLYRLIMRSNQPAAKPFQDWVVQEVLPTIRKTGKYDRFDVSNDTELLRGAEFFLDQLTKKVRELEAKVEEDAPKVFLAEEFFESDGLMGLREAARGFGIPQNTFTGHLRDWGWIDLHGVAAKAYATSQGYMENKVFVHVAGQTVSGKLTRKGVDAASRKLAKYVEA